MKKIEIVTELAKYKVLLAILGILSTWSAFEVWKWQQQQHEKFIAQKQEACQQRLDTANRYIQSNRFLKAAYYASKTQEQLKIQLNKPGITTDFQPDKNYILIHDKPVPLIPTNPRYEGGLFERLSRQPDKYPPEPLIVTGKKISGNKVEVISACAPKSFTVSVENLYEITQPLDLTPYLPAFSGF